MEKNMKIEKNKVVVITYDLNVEGKHVDSATEERPLDYIQGGHMLLPRFEQELEGKQEGDDFRFSIPPEEGYGQYDAKYRFDIPKSSFEQNGKLREDLLTAGRIIPMYNSEGVVCRAQIIEVKAESVTVDFNHPLAGRTLDFSGKVLSVRDASEKELLEGLHGEFLPPEEHHCGHHGGGCCHGGGGCHGEGHEGGCHGEGHEGGCLGEGGCHGGCKN